MRKCPPFSPRITIGFLEWEGERWDSKGRSRPKYRSLASPGHWIYLLARDTNRWTATLVWISFRSINVTFQSEMENSPAGERRSRWRRKAVAANCVCVRAQEAILIPSRSKTVIKCKAERMMKRALAPWAVLGPSHRAQTLQKSGINIGSALTGAKLETVPVHLVNTSNQEYLIRRGTTLAVMRPTTSIQKGADHKANRGTVSVRVMTADPNATAQAGRQRARVKIEKVPEHIRPLFEGISSEITPLQKEELAAKLTRYQDVFRRGPDNMGCTDLVNIRLIQGKHDLLVHPHAACQSLNRALSKKRWWRCLTEGW